ncbi:extracellular solute-binding protein (family 3) [Roseibium hamelinense]|uniref:Extracellular solute-binding protein (Family 3) n=1 Tax=Roseibium hamelinense TaxID=150831 RepID=A0A562TGM8_9HYPH|nr:transporter substrate-binding domain-containing protein [Roseibium hamelinense]TWI92759.1 extracellular solute-binding protein (family 3) [Roseibium hamelinense]
MLLKLKPTVRYSIAAAGLSAALLAPISAQAEDIVVGVENLSYYPHYTMDGGEYGGFARALLDAWAADQGHNLTYKPFPITRLMSMLVNGEVDLKYPDNAYWSADMKQDKNVIYSEQIVEYIDGVSVKPEKIGAGMGAVETLGTVRGFTPWSWLDETKSGQVKLSEVNELDGLVKQAVSDRIDAAYANVAVIQHHLSETGQDGALVFDPDLKHTRDFYYMSSTTKPGLIEDFNGWMAANQDKVDALKAEYNVALD